MSLYMVERSHLEALKTVARRLFTEERMNGDEMRDAAGTIAAVIAFAETVGQIDDLFTSKRRK